MMEEIRELDDVVLTVDVPDYRLRAGDVGTVVDIRPDGSEYTLEFFTLTGETVAVVPLLPSQVRAIGAREIASARVME